MDKIPYVISPSSINFIYKDEPYVIPKDHENFDKIASCLLNCNYDEAILLSDLSIDIKMYDKDIKVKDGVVYYKDEQLHGVIVETILNMIEQEYASLYIIKFLEKLWTNPSKRAQNELYDFLANAKIPLATDGDFLVYKAVSSDYKDLRTGTFDNSVGKECSMPREKVNDDPNVTCSRGLHVASYSYAKGFGSSSSKLVLCKVNPRDVVSIPNDYNHTKMRTCRYEVVADVTGKGDVLEGHAVFDLGRLDGLT